MSWMYIYWIIHYFVEGGEGKMKIVTWDLEKLKGVKNDFGKMTAS